MGLLDDAIREHLELKRRRGADPGEVARQQREALDPVLDESAAPEHEGPQLDDGGEELHEPPLEEEHAAAADPEGNAIELPPTGQETAEIDMRSVLEAADDPSTGVSPAARVPQADRVSEEDSFAWEMPGNQEAEQPPAEIPGQERLTFE